MATYVMLAHFTERGITNIKNTAKRAEDFKLMASAHGVSRRKPGRAFTPMTLGNMRELGVRSLVVTCEICHHEALLPADRWHDAVLVSAFRPRMVCTRCGIVGADVRPNWLEHKAVRQYSASVCRRSRPKCWAELTCSAVVRLIAWWTVPVGPPRRAKRAAVLPPRAPQLERPVSAHPRCPRAPVRRSVVT